ncbi:MAG: META domain-containing protein [Anaerolineae bacterium]
MKKLKQQSAIFIGTLLLLALAACTPTVDTGDSQPADPTPEDKAVVDPVEPDESVAEGNEAMSELDGTNWNLVTLDGTDVTDKGATLEFIAGQASGSDSCNQFGNRYRVDGNELVFDGPFISTQMACPDMEISAQYLEMLSTASAFLLDGETLSIQTDQGELVFSQPVSADLENTKWSLTGLNSGNAIVSMAIDQNIFLLIEGDAVGGSGGCNSFGGGVEIENNQIAFKELFSTQMFCEGDGISERESEFLAALDQARSFEILRQSLTMFDADGNLVATFQTAGDKMNVKTVFIGAEQVDCVGVAPQKCLLIKEDPNAEYTFFYDSIDGFEWEAGFEYELLVNIIDVENPPADASSLRYELVEIVAKTAAESAESTALIEGVTWSLIHLVVGGDAVVPAPAGTNIYFEIDGGTMAGNSGCNMFNGPISLDGNSVVMGPFVTTRMACMEESMAFESAILEQLAQVGAYMIDGKNLILSTADGLLLAEFTMAETKTLFVGAEQVDCEGAAPQKCLLVKESADAEYTYFYDSIEGFEWEAGFIYELLVSVTEVKEPLADASSLVYKLVQIVSQAPVAE